MEGESVEIPFPARGVDVSVPLSAQPPLTAAVGANVRGQDPFLSRQRGGSRTGLSKFADQVPAGAELIQMLEPIVDPRYDNLSINFEDYEPEWIDDTSTNNLATRNPGLGQIWARKIPPRGAGPSPIRTRPQQVRRRVQLIASTLTPLTGETVTLDATVFQVNTGGVVVGVTVVLSTVPRGRDGDGDTAVTNGSGVASFSVTEPTYEGQILYYASHTYTPAGARFKTTVRGMASVVWSPAFTLALESPQGLSFPADGVTHPLLATLTRTATGAPVRGRLIRMTTDPAAYPGDRSQKYTNAFGKALFPVSSSSNAVVDYRALLLGIRPGQVTLTLSNIVTLTWSGGGDCFILCNGSIANAATGIGQAEDPPNQDVIFNDDGGQPNYVLWAISYEVRCYDDQGGFVVQSTVLVGKALIFDDSGDQTPIADCADMLLALGMFDDSSGFECSMTSDPGEIIDLINDGSPYQAEYDAALGPIQADACA